MPRVKWVSLLVVLLLTQSAQETGLQETAAQKEAPYHIATCTRAN
jgi:hypothetical protein